MTSLVRVLTSNEPWVEYQLEDGTLLRFRFSACSFRKTGKQTDQGDPEYSFAHSLQIETHAPKAGKLVVVDRIFPDFKPHDGMAEYLAPEQDSA